MPTVFPLFSGNNANNLPDTFPVSAGHKIPTLPITLPLSEHRFWGRTITNLRFADDIDGLAGEDEELANLVERLNKTSTAYVMEISAEKTKLMTNNTSGINTEIKVNGHKLETVTSFKHLGSVINDEGSKPEILSRIAQATAELTKLNQFGMIRVFLSVPK